MSQFDNIGPGGVPSFARPVQLNANDTTMAQLSNGQIPANTIATMGSGAGVNALGGTKPNETVLRQMSLGHVVPNLPYNAQPATPPANGTTNKGTNISTQVTASIAAGVMTVTGITGLATLAVGLQILGPAGWPQNLSIVSLGTGTGGLGTYNMSAPGIPTGSISAPTAVASVCVGSGG